MLVCRGTVSTRQTAARQEGVAGRPGTSRCVGASSPTRPLADSLERLLPTPASRATVSATSAALLDSGNKESRGGSEPYGVNAVPTALTRTLLGPPNLSAIAALYTQVALAGA